MGVIAFQLFLVLTSMAEEATADWHSLHNHHKARNKIQHTHFELCLLFVLESNDYVFCILHNFGKMLTEAAAIVCEIIQNKITNTLMCFLRFTDELNACIVLRVLHCFRNDIVMDC